MFSAQAIINMIQNTINASKVGCLSGGNRSFLDVSDSNNEVVSLAIQYGADSITVFQDEKVIKNISVSAQTHKDDAYRSAYSILQEIKDILA